MKKDIIVIGDGGHARMIIDFLEETDQFNIIGVTSKNPDRKKFYNYLVIGDDSVLKYYYKKGEIRNVAIGIGGFRDNSLRKEVFEKVKKIGFSVQSIIHKSAVVSRYAQIGEGCIIMPNVTINNDVTIGNNCIIANGVVISHESVIGNHVLLSAGVIVGGNAIIGSGSLLALGSKVISGVKIGKNVLIGAGAVVVKDCLQEGTYMGIPARKIK